MRRPLLTGLVLAALVLPAAGRAAQPNRWAVGWFNLQATRPWSSRQDGIDGWRDLSGLQVRRRLRRGWDLTLLIHYGRIHEREITAIQSREGDAEPVPGARIRNHDGHGVTAGFWLGNRLAAGPRLSLWTELGLLYGRSRSAWDDRDLNGTEGRNRFGNRSRFHTWRGYLGLRLAWRAGRHWRLETRWGWRYLHRAGEVEIWRAEQTPEGWETNRIRNRITKRSLGTYGWIGEPSLSILYAF